jgi:putative effector of murein hydrolase LrgA (UPF0299 family)
MERFAVLTLVGRILECIGGGILGLGILFDVLLLGIGKIPITSILDAAGLVLTLLSPIWVGLCTIAAGQVLRVLAVIAQATQESAAHLAELRRS